MRERRGLQAMLQTIDREPGGVAAKQLELRDKTVRKLPREALQLASNQLPVIVGAFGHYAKPGYGARQDLRSRRRCSRSRERPVAGYAGDVWFPQPAPKDHPWRRMPHHGMTPHTSGTSLSAQARYAAGTREILECWFEDRPIREEYLIVSGGQLAGAGAHSYSVGKNRSAAFLGAAAQARLRPRKGGQNG